MSRAVLLLAAVLLLSSSGSGLLAQPDMARKYSDLGIQFTASPNWTKVNKGDAKSGYEFVNLNNNLQVRISCTLTDIPALDYLSSEVCREGRTSTEGPFAIMIEDRLAYGICVVCTEMRKPIRLMIVAVPADEGVYLLRFKCPEDCYTEHKKQIEEILGIDPIGTVPTIQTMQLASLDG